jgi:hypothetical protein
MIGANDVTHRMPMREAAGQLGEAVARLRAVGCEVVVGTCPDLGTIRPDARSRDRRAPPAPRSAAPEPTRAR